MPLKVNQIVFLEDRGSNLYGEVIQLIPRRDLCWFRPICLVMSSDPTRHVDSKLENNGFPTTNHSQSDRIKVDSNIALEDWKTKRQAFSFGEDVVTNSFDLVETNLIDLRSSPDLLWPAILFEPALDTETIGFLANLGDIAHPSIDIKSNHKYLNKFVQKFWKANQDKF